VHALLFCFSLLGVHDLVLLPTTRSVTPKKNLMDILHNIFQMIICGWLMRVGSQKNI
jgi:hypothetical protein